MQQARTKTPAPPMAPSIVVEMAEDDPELLLLIALPIEGKGVGLPGTYVGTGVGEPAENEGLIVGSEEGAGVRRVGGIDGAGVGITLVGMLDGASVGAAVGISDGRKDGACHMQPIQ